MTVYELDKKATPGELHSDGDGRIYGPNPEFDPADLQTHEEILIADTAPDDMALTEYDQANAQLLAHCRNNFMKALEALKAWQETYNAWLVSDHPFEIEFPDSAALIERLENIDEST